MRTITAAVPPLTIEVEVGDFTTDEQIQIALRDKVIEHLEGNGIDITDVEYGERDEPFDMSGSTPGVER